MKQHSSRFLRFFLLGIFFLMGLVSSYSWAEPLTNSDNSIDSSNDDLAHLELILPKHQFYLGEKVPFRVKLTVTNLAVTYVDKPELTQPEFVFNLRGVTQNQFKINGRSGQTFDFSYYLVPVRTGTVAFGPLKLDCTIVINERHQLLEVLSNAATIRVLPVPQSRRPYDFSGAVGTFGMNISASSRQVLQGEPVTLKITVSGDGSLQGITPPYLSNANGLKVYDPQKQNSGGSVGFWETATFEQIVIPMSLSTKQIGPFAFSYFNPNTGRYQVLHSAAIPIAVKPNPKLQLDENSVEVLSQKLTSQKETPGSLSTQKKPLIGQIWFWLLQLIPLLGLAGSYSYHRYQQMLQTDSEQARAIKAGQKVRRQLEKARHCLDSGNYDALLNELQTAIAEYLSERYRIPAAGITGAVARHLAEQGATEELVKDMESFFSQYDFHRFTGAKLTSEAATQLWETVNRMIQAMNEIVSTKESSGADQRKGGRSSHE